MPKKEIKENPQKIIEETLKECEDWDKKQPKEKIEDWEKEFDEKFVRLLGNAKVPVADLFPAVYIKDFICQLLKSEKEKLLERIEVPKIFIKYVNNLDRAGTIYTDDRTKNEDWVDGYNHAIADLEKLKEEIKKE